MMLTWLDWLLMLGYFGFGLGIGFALKRTTTTSVDFILGRRVAAGGRMPAGVVGRGENEEP